MKNSKKGITLVELVICCAIIVMLGGACTAVLASGSHIFNTSTSAAEAQMDSDLMQTHMINLIPYTKQVSLTEPANMTNWNCLKFNDEGVFVIHANGKDTTIPSISEVKYSFAQAGTSQSARAQLQYTVTTEDGSSYTGGFILSNMKYSDIVSSLGSAVTDKLISAAPLYFSSVAPSN